MRYDSFYEWAARPGLDERLKRIATATLARIPIQDLADLQRHKTKIDSRERPFRVSLFIVGQAKYDPERGENLCSILIEPEMPEAAIAGILAHELAHVRLGHTSQLFLEATTEAEEKRFEQQREREADCLVARWGFGSELKAAREYTDWRSEIISENLDKFLG